MVTVVVEIQPVFSAYVIGADPTAMPVITPLAELAVAIEVAPLDQVPPAGLAPNCWVVPLQKLRVPLMGGGVVLSVTDTGLVVAVEAPQPTTHS
jgi:hypothetical protein